MSFNVSLEGSTMRTDQMDNPFRAGSSVPLTQLYERKSRRGRNYLVGRIGSPKILVIATGGDSRGDPVWQMYISAGPYAPEGAAALAQELETAPA